MGERGDLQIFAAQRHQLRLFVFVPGGEQALVDLQRAGLGDRAEGDCKLILDIGWLPTMIPRGHRDGMSERQILETS